MAATFERITNRLLADYCEHNGYPSVGENLAAGQTQEEATAYLLDQPPWYDDGEGRWLADYVRALHGQKPHWTLAENGAWLHAVPEREEG
jgi:hypothetical protein